MRFWDSSALVPLLIEEPSSERLEHIGRDGVPMAVWWGTPVELTSALVRRARGGKITANARDDGLVRLARLAGLWRLIWPDDVLRESAVRAVRLHALAAGDALQLAAAMAWAGRPTGQAFMTLDHELAVAALVEGFTVLPA